jgi:hypothetical protein
MVSCGECKSCGLRYGESIVVKVELPPPSPETEPDDELEDENWGKEEKSEDLATVKLPKR